MAKPHEPGKRIGGRGCPSCGSHNTEALTRTGAQWCDTCGHRWTPCTAHCRGYKLEIDESIPLIKGCRECGVPDKIARWWPEAYRGMALLLAQKKDKLEAVGDN